MAETKVEAEKAFDLVLETFVGAYSNRARGQRRKAEAQLQGNGPGGDEEPVPPSPERAALRRRWTRLIRRLYEVDPVAHIA
jgi:hypothetical protein